MPAPAPPRAGRAPAAARLARRLAACLLAGSAACATVAPFPDAELPGAADLLGGSALPGPPPPPVAADIMGLTDGMRAFLAGAVRRQDLPAMRLQRLVAAIIDAGNGFRVEYDGSTHTAAETFAERRGNCLSFSNLFVALARGAGLEVAFQEVDVPPDWSLDGETLVLSRHVNVLVDLGPAGTRVVDFNIGDFRSSYDMRRISDDRARAHYWNNRGVERMQDGDAPAALACFRRALEEGDRAFAPAWTNLGTLYLRHGQERHAEAAYLEAVRTGDDLVATSNLARLYARRGDGGRSAALAERVAVHRMRNPYFRYALARRALAEGDAEAAIRHVKFAIQRRPREDRFCFLLGRAYLQSGDVRAARHWFARAREVAASEATKRGYSRKMETLLEATGG